MIMRSDRWFVFYIPSMGGSVARSRGEAEKGPLNGRELNKPRIITGMKIFSYFYSN